MQIPSIAVTVCPCNTKLGEVVKLVSFTGNAVISGTPKTFEPVVHLMPYPWKDHKSTCIIIWNCTSRERLKVIYQRTALVPTNIKRYFKRLMKQLFQKQNLTKALICWINSIKAIKKSQNLYINVTYFLNLLPVSQSLSELVSQPTRQPENQLLSRLTSQQWHSHLVTQTIKLQSVNHRAS